MSGARATGRIHPTTVQHGVLRDGCTMARNGATTREAGDRVSFMVLPQATPMDITRTTDGTIAIITIITTITVMTTDITKTG